MKRVFMIFGAAILICGIALAANAQTPTGLNTSTPSGAMEGTGTIAQIDPKERTITLRDYTVSSNSTELTESPNEPANDTKAESTNSDTKVFKYSERTNFASTNPEQMTGRMSDLKVGDVVVIQFDDQNNILRIEEKTAPPQNQP